MVDLIFAVHKTVPWRKRLKLLFLHGWSNADKSTLPSDHVFWTNGTYTLHYRASWLATIPFDKFCKLVQEGDISSC